MQELRFATKAAPGAVELEGPQKIVGLFEVGTDRDNFVDEVGSAANPKTSQTFLDDGVVTDGDPLLVELAETALVNEFLDGGTGWVPVRDVRFNQAQHPDGGLVQLHKRGVVQLKQAEELWQRSEETG